MSLRKFLIPPELRYLAGMDFVSELFETFNDARTSHIKVNKDRMPMADDLKIAKPALAKIHQDMDAINRLAKPSCLSVIEQMERTMEPIRRYQLEMSRSLESLESVVRLKDIAGANQNWLKDIVGANQHWQEIVRLEISRTVDVSEMSARLKDIAGANQHWQEIVKQSAATTRIAECLNLAHRSWFEHIKPIQHDFSQLQISAKQALCDVSLRLTATERLMAGIDFEAIKNRFQMRMPVISGLESSIAKVASSYGIFAESLREISDITRLPAFVLPGATREIYTTGVVLETLRPWDDRHEEDTESEIQLIGEAESETSGCITLLRQVDPGLLRPYIGARDALNGQNVDRARHILSSLREVWSHLLRFLAPDDLVSAWISGIAHQQDLLHDGRPTRRAKILYICRELNSGPLTEFLTHDTRALVKLIELFHRLHELETELTDEQLRAILLKTESWLMYILQIWAGTLRK